jgi:benzodiazapine receptor
LKNKKKFLKNIFIPVILGGLVGLIIFKFLDYQYLNKPPLSPPGFAFGIVWTVIYLLMGVSYGILDIKDFNDIKIVYYLQLVINLMWPIIFFIFKWRLFALIWLILLVVLVIYMIILFYKKDKNSAYIQIPYLLWCIFATYLNLGIYVLNK